MKQTEYLNSVLKYYHENGIIPGDPNEGRWEDAHTPYPRGMADDTVPLLHEHHIVHDLWQSAELDECHFFPPDVKRVLYSPGFWPLNWFELCDTFEKYHAAVLKKGGDQRGKSSVEKQLGIHSPTYTKEQRQKAGSIGGTKAQVTQKAKKIGVYDPAVRSKNCFDSDRARNAANITNAQVWECLVTGMRSTASGLAKFQRNRNIDTKLRKRIK